MPKCRGCCDVLPVSALNERHSTAYGFNTCSVKAPRVALHSVASVHEDIARKVSSLPKLTHHKSHYIRPIFQIRSTARLRTNLAMRSAVGDLAGMQGVAEDAWSARATFLGDSGHK